MNVLYITYSFPFHTKTGSSVRTSYQIECLSKYYLVDVVYINKNKKHIEQVNTYKNSNFLPVNVRIIEVLHLKTDNSTLGKRIHNYLEPLLFKNNAVIENCISKHIKSNGYNVLFFRSNVISNLINFKQFNLPVVVDFDDDPLQVIENANYKKRKFGFIFKLLLQQNAQRFYKRHYQTAAALVFANTPSPYFLNYNYQVVPNVYNFNLKHTNTETTSFIYFSFLGNFSHQPNIDAVEFFVNEVWNSIKDDIHLSFCIAGKNLPEIYEQKWKSDKTIILGEVEDLESFYNNSLFTIAPMVSGSGTNIKILESLSYGRICITSSFGSRGFEELYQQLTYNSIADTRSEWKNIIQYLTVNQEFTINLGEEACSKASAAFSVAVMEHKLKTIIDNLFRK